jgi:hypothetical protein
MPLDPGGSITAQHAFYLHGVKLDALVILG